MAFLQEYTMLDELGQGGFATVYKVRHNELGYVRAVRVLNETIVDSASKTYQKFLRECKVLLRLGNGNHPNIVHIYQPRLLDNKALVEMDYVDGQDILHYLKANQNCVPVEEVIRMAAQISSALAYCHEGIYRFCMDRDEDKLQDDPDDGTKVLIDDKTRKKLISKYKVIHNDIHSGNIMRREDGNFVLLDFGLAITGDEIVRSSRHTNGAPEFKAPEKWDDDSVLTEQSDIYSFGIVMYQCLAGRVPFPYDKKEKSNYKAEFNLAEAHKKAIPPSIEDIRRENFERIHNGEDYKRDFPQWLEEAILKCLRKNPSERFRNGKELCDFILANVQTANASCNDAEFERLNIENKNLVSQLNGLRTANRNLNDSLNTKQNECISLSLELRISTEKIESLSNEINNLKKEKKNPLLIVLIVLFSLWGLGMSLYNYYILNNEDFVSSDAVVLHDTIIDSSVNETAKYVYESQIRQLNNQINDYQKQLKQKDDELSKLRNKMNTADPNENQEEVLSLKAQIKQKEKEVQRLNNDLKQKIKDLEQANKEIKILNNVISECK